MTEKKKKIGRPVKQLKDYGLRDDWKDVVFEMSAIGCSDVEIRTALVWDGKSFNHNAWDKLQEIDEEFLTTINKAKHLCQTWWERQGRTGVRDKTFQTALWFINMKNRFGWTDNREAKVSIEDAEKHFKTIADAITKSDTNSS